MADESNGVIRAAGGVVWRLAPDESGVEVAVIHRPRYDDWSFPKGKLASGETEFDGALREVFEETGYRVRPGRALGEVRYLRQNGTGGEKVVRYWAMQAVGGAFTPNREVDDLRWLALEETAQGLTRDSDREVLQRFMSGPISTRTVLVVRHGSAGTRSEWKGDDSLRPLDETGRRQARELVPMLSRFDVKELVSAHYVRCVQTLEPLAESIGLEVREEPLLSEEGFPGRESEAVEAIRGLGHNGDAVVACSQRLVMPKLLERLAADDDVELPHLRAKKGSVWVLSFDGRRLFDAEYFPPTRL
jgi:8-oxo-dGTP pyrophosphatase MutT (NUDIX family)